MPLGGNFSVQCYERALTACYNGLKEMLADSVPDLCDASDYMVFHSTSVYLIKRGFRALVSAQYGNTVALGARQDLYEKRVDPGTLLCRFVGSMYTAAV